MGNYYLYTDGYLNGPLSIEDLRRKKITKNTQIWIDSSNEWKTAGKIPELQSITIPDVPTQSIREWFKSKWSRDKKNRRYSCKKCGTLRYSDQLPKDDDCPKGDKHNWTDVDKLHLELRLLYAGMVICFFLAAYITWEALITVIKTDFKTWNHYLSGTVAFLVTGFSFFWLAKKREPRNEHKPNYGRAIIVTSIGVLLLLSSLLFLIYFHQVPKTSRPTLSSLLWFTNVITRDIGIAMLTAGIIAMILEVQNFMEFVSKTVINSLTSDDYLNKLPEGKLLAIKTSCSRKIIEANNNRDEPNLNESLLELEAAISKQIFTPYFDKFRIRVESQEMRADTIFEFPLVQENNNKNIVLDVKVEASTGSETEKDLGNALAPKALFPTRKGNLLEQRIHTKYTIVNPKQGYGKETIMATYQMALPEGVDEKTEIHGLIRLEKFEVTIDKEDKRDLTHEMIHKVELRPAQQVFKYDVSTSLIHKDTKAELIIPYDNKLTVEMTEVIYVPVDDGSYSRRLSKPTKNSSVFYQYKPLDNRQKIKFQANCFCTLKEYYEAITINGGSDYVEVICDNWLLPGNGYCITHMPEQPKADT